MVKRQGKRGKREVEVYRVRAKLQKKREKTENQEEVGLEGDAPLPGWQTQGPSRVRQMRRRGGERERGERKGGEFDVGSQAHHPPAAFLSFSTTPPPRPHSSRKSMPALLVFLPSLAKARRRGEQTSGLLVRPWPAVCDAIWELFSLLPF